jgi:hypothetical protein
MQGGIIKRNTVPGAARLALNNVLVRQTKGIEGSYDMIEERLRVAVP